jgi:hypothetical protein
LKSLVFKHQGWDTAAVGIDITGRLGFLADVDTAQRNVRMVVHRFYRI